MDRNIDVYVSMHAYWSEAVPWYEHSRIVVKENEQAESDTNHSGSVECYGIKYFLTRAALTFSWSWWIDTVVVPTQYHHQISVGTSKREIKRLTSKIRRRVLLPSITPALLQWGHPGRMRRQWSVEDSSKHCKSTVRHSHTATHTCMHNIHVEHWIKFYSLLHGLGMLRNPLCTNLQQRR